VAQRSLFNTARAAGILSEVLLLRKRGRADKGMGNDSGGSGMRKLVLWDIMSAALAGLSALWLVQAAHAQQAPAPPVSEQPAKVSDTELRAFAKAYVEFHKIRQRYESSLSGTQDPAAKEKLRQEGNRKAKEAIQKQGLSVETYNRIFTTVNGDADLRSKALKLIDEERKKS
jgi:hypothetical protein